jgi:hypothetical protein
VRTAIHRAALRLTGTLLLLLVFGACRHAVGPPLAEVGRAIYEQGRLPDGAPVRAMRPEGFEVTGEYAACATCHRRSGMGSVEGSLDRTVLVPPIVGPLLFAPARFHGRYLDALHHWVPNEPWKRALERGAYDEASLARALREGVDPDGNVLVSPMPLYALDGDAVAALAAHLRTLAAEPAPGVEERVLHLATIVTPGADPDEAERVLGVLRAWSAGSRASGHEWRLHEWRLDGDPGRWPAQLDARYLDRPVFAVLSGAGGAQWEPVHRFCERQRIPCVLPSLEIAPDARDAYYSIYFSPGVPLEARILARALKPAHDGDAAPSRVVQVIGDDVGEQAAGAFAAALHGTDLAPTDRRFRWSAPASAVADLAPEDALVLWLRSGEVAELAAAVPDGPAAERVYLSALLAPPEALSLPSRWRERVVWVSLFDDLGVQGELSRLRLRAWLARAGLPTPVSLRAEADAYVAAYLTSEALSEIRQQEVRRPEVPLGRDHLIETIETLANKYSDGTEIVDPDGHVAFYGRMSLGPGQRTAVRGGILVRRASPGSPGSNRLAPIGARIVP